MGSHPHFRRNTTTSLAAYRVLAQGNCSMDLLVIRITCGYAFKSFSGRLGSQYGQEIFNDPFCVMDPYSRKKLRTLGSLDA